MGVCLYIHAGYRLTSLPMFSYSLVNPALDFTINFEEQEIKLMGQEMKVDQIFVSVFSLSGNNQLITCHVNSYRNLSSKVKFNPKKIIQKSYTQIRATPKSTPC